MCYTPTEQPPTALYSFGICWTDPTVSGCGKDQCQSGVFVCFAPKTFLLLPYQWLEILRLFQTSTKKTLLSSAGIQCHRCTFSVQTKTLNLLIETWQSQDCSFQGYTKGIALGLLEVRICVSRQWIPKTLAERTKVSNQRFVSPLCLPTWAIGDWWNLQDGRRGILHLKSLKLQAGWPGWSPRWRMLFSFTRGIAVLAWWTGVSGFGVYREDVAVGGPHQLQSNYSELRCPWAWQDRLLSLLPWAWFSSGEHTQI